MGEGFQLIIIGGGPAGISAGIYSARQGLEVLLVTEDFGGQMTRKSVAIENYPGFESISGQDLIEKFSSHLKQYPIEIEKQKVTKVKKKQDRFLVETESGKQFQSRAVLVASGADPRPLEVPGEKEFIGKGVSYCAVCDGALFSDQRVAVIGGGNAGLEAAVFLSRIAAQVFVLEYRSELTANSINRERIKGIENIKTLTGVALKEIKGQDFVEKIIYKDRESGSEKELKVKGVFVQIGTVPATDFVKDLVEFDQKDQILINPKTCETKTSGLFAAGDVTDAPYKQIVIAAGQGAQAALAVQGYLRDLKT